MESGVCSAFPLLNIPGDVWTDKIGTDRNMFWITTSCVLHGRGRGRGHTLSLSPSLAHSLIHSLAVFLQETHITGRHIKGMYQPAGGAIKGG